MALTSPITSVLNASLFSAAAPVWLRNLDGVGSMAPAIAHPVGASTLLGVNHPGRLDTDRVFKFYGDGSTTVFTLPTAASGVTYPTTNAASLTVGNYLETIALTYPENYSQNGLVRQRVGSDATPTGTQFKINGTTVTFGTAPAAGQVVEILVPDPNEIVSLFGGTPSSPTAANAHVMSTITARDFMSAGVAVVNIIGIRST